MTIAYRPLQLVLLVLLLPMLAGCLLGRAREPAIRYHPLAVPPPPPVTVPREAPGLHLMPVTAPTLYHQAWVVARADGSLTPLRDHYWETLPSDSIGDALDVLLFDSGLATASNATDARLLEIELDHLVLHRRGEPKAVIGLRWRLRDSDGTALDGGRVGHRAAATNDDAEALAAAASEALAATCNEIATAVALRLEGPELLSLPVGP